MANYTGILKVFLLFTFLLLLIGVQGNAAMLCDLNSDLTIDLADCILGLKIELGLPPGSIEVDLAADANADGVLGLAESLCALQVIAGVRNHPDIDDDNDGYTETAGDCDDDADSVHPGASDTCDDGIDQNCDGSDAVCVPANTYVYEHFSSGPGDFIDLWGYQAQGGKFRFQGDNSDFTALTFWNGGTNPSWGWDFQPSHSNYFSDANISVTADWESGETDWLYGLAVFMDQNSHGSEDWIRFAIAKSGYYTVGASTIAGYEDVIGWKRTFLLNITGQQNHLEVEKRGNLYRFFINGYEVDTATIDGFTGGGIGLETSNKVQVSYDDYKIASPYRGQLVIPSEGYRKKRNQLIYSCMTSTYFWADQVPAIDHESYASAENLLEDLKYDALDRWSYIEPKEVYEQLFQEGQYIGLGMGIKTEGSSCRITFVYPESPAAQAGVQRGDHILTINDKTIEEINDTGSWDTIFGPREVGVVVEGQISRDGGPPFDIAFEKDVIDIKAALYSDVLSVQEQQVGYLVFNKFLNTALTDLNTVFEDFKSTGVDELIIDLRYNSGGSLSVAKHIVDRIVGQNLDGQTWLKLSHNDSYAIWDTDYDFQYSSATLSLERLLVISGEDTCSASEVLINGLRPYMNVVVIGRTTCGKPVGMHGYDIYDLHISPIEFSVRNANDAGDYYDGLQPTCVADDNLDHPLGDPVESALHEALDFIQSGQCSLGAELRQAARSSIVKPARVIMTGFRREIGAF